MSRRRLLALAGVAALGIQHVARWALSGNQVGVSNARNVYGRPDNTFFVIGDFGSGSPEQYRVARQMMAQPEVKQAKAEGTGHQLKIFTVGDNLYPDGDYRRFGENGFERPFGELIGMGIQFVFTYGNHDLFGERVDTQLEAFRQYEERLDTSGQPERAPERLYTRARFDAWDMDVFIIDTNVFDGTLNNWRRYPHPENPFLNWIESGQNDWLPEVFSQSRARWKIILGHHPFKTAKRDAPHTRPLQALIDRLKPDVFIAGHHHGYERFDPKANHGIHYFVSAGGGADMDPFFRYSPEDNVVRLNRHHFMKFVVEDDALRFAVIDEHGEVIDSGRIRKNPFRRG